MCVGHLTKDTQMLAIASEDSEFKICDVQLQSDRPSATDVN
jgi:hypothetical protein